MINTTDIKKLFIDKYNINKDIDYLELRNIIFEVDKNYIFEYNGLLNMDDQWYIDNYEIRINFQINNLINRIIENPNTRQAVLILAQQNELEQPGFICTIYTHIFLDKINDNEYNIEYSVHMRSNNVIDFISDVKWNNKIYDKIINELSKKTNWKLYKTNMIWCVDSMHIFKKNFNLLK